MSEEDGMDGSYLRGCRTVSVVFGEFQSRDGGVDGFDAQCPSRFLVTHHCWHPSLLALTICSDSENAPSGIG